MGSLLNLARILVLSGVVFLASSFAVCAQEDDKPLLKKDELAQIVAPVALYPDALLAQVFMASTYPLEIVEADRWVKKNKSLKDDALAKELEKQKWDPSVKSLVNFPSVLESMSEKLELTTKMGDAFLAQQKDMMDVVQELRKQAMDAGNLKTSKEQKVVVEKETIIIQPANPQIVYVPTYSPTVVYGVWPYPYYPPYYYYPPPPPGHSFAVGLAVGVAWGYAWGGCNWNSGHVHVNINQNIHINNTINRNRYNVNNRGNGAWQHDPGHRRGVAYRDTVTSRKFNRASPADAARSREAFRGRSDQNFQRPSGAGVDRAGGALPSNQRGQALDRGRPANRESGRPSVNGANAFSGMDRGNSARDFSARGSSSRKATPARANGGVPKSGRMHGR